MIKFLGAILFAAGLFTSVSAFAGDRTVALAVPGMYCATCPITVKSSLEAVPGVEKVVVSLSEKTAVVTL